METQPVDDLVDGLALGAEGDPTRSRSSAATLATAVRFASS
jgi:hypothetical protein